MAESLPSFRKLEDKVAIITGGASGIGEAAARLFADHGPRAIVIADIQDDLGQIVVESVGSNICSYFHCDVSDEDQVRAMVDWTVQKYGQLDIMFSNAGIYTATTRSEQKILELDLSALDKLFAVNVRGMAACVKHAARVMVEQNVKGNIVCTTSIAALKGSENRTDYFMSKHAILGLMRCASKQLGEYGIRVNTVSPFAVATPMATKAFNMDVEEFEKLFQPLTSLKDTALKAKHVAEAVLFLVSADSGFITGHNLVIDGGATT